MSVETLSTSVGARLALHSPRCSAKQRRAFPDKRNSLRHPNSLIDVTQHDAALVQLIDSKVDLDVVRLLIKAAENVIHIPNDATQAAALPSPPITPVKGTFEQQRAASTQAHIFNHPKWRPLNRFIWHLVNASRVNMGTLLATVVYLHRLKLKLPAIAQGEHFLTICHNLRPLT